MKTALLDLTTWVNILAIDSEHKMAFVEDEGGEEFEVPLDRLDNIKVIFDLEPLEKD